MSVQAFGSELAIQALDEGIVRGLARTRKVELDVFGVSPEIKILRDELRSLVNPDGFGVAEPGTNPLDTRSFPTASWSTSSAPAFPYIIGTVLAICSLVFLLRPDPEPDWPHVRDFIEIVFAAAVMFLYAWVLPEIGFVVSTVFVTAYLTWRLGTQPAPALVTGAATSGGIYVVFHLILGLSLARGPFGF